MNRVLSIPGLMVLLLVVAGCSRKVTSSTTTEVTDSVYVKEVPRFIEILIPGDTVEIERMVECDSVTNKPKPFTVRKKSKTASLTVGIDSQGRLTGTGVCDSLQKIIEAKDKEITRIRKEKTKEVIVQTEYKPRGIDIFCRWFTGISMLTCIALIFFFLNKKF